MLSLYGTPGYYVGDYYHCQDSVTPIQNRWKNFLNNFDYDHSLFISSQDIVDNSLVYKFYVYDANIRNKEINHEYINNIDILNKFNKYFSDNVSDLLKTVTPISIDAEYRDEFKSLWLNSHHQSAEKSSNNSKIISSLTNSSSKNNQPSPELEVFRWYLKGKTAAETAVILGISRRTVETLLERLKKKLNCFSKAQLISKLGDIAS